MRAFVTGATGFIGSNLIRELLADGDEVRALVRPESDRRAIQGLPVEQIEGDLQDPTSLRTGLEGCDVLYHVAAHYAFWPPRHQLTYAINVQGTANVLAAARQAGVRRVVHTSSSATVGLASNGTPADETTPLDPRDVQDGYKRSKYLAEGEALRASQDGLEVVVVNPTAPLGPWDAKPTPTGRIVLEFLRGRMFGYTETGLNVVHVRDVARGHILAMRKGRPGQRYILGNRNMSLRQVFEVLGRVAGRRPPRLRVPYGAALVFASLDELVEGRLLRRKPRATVAEVRLSRKPMYYSAARAVRELGIPQTDPEMALRDAVRWFKEYGYA